MSGNENQRVLEALERLQVSLKELKDKEDPPHLTHWRSLDDVQAAYKYISQGAELCKATSTKYTLVGKIDSVEGSKLAKELLQGCELIATGALVICSNDAGCARACRYHVKQATRAVVHTTLELVKVFAQHHEHDTDTLAAQKTGAVWSTCDALLNVPQGNRNSIRRELFTHVMECNETLQEFQQMMDQGAMNSGALDTIAEDSTATQQQEEETSWDDFLQGNDDQYTASELPIATASLCLIKCSRGSINITLKACESVGDVVESDNTTSDKNVLLEWIMKLTNLARVVGDGMTDLGTCLYPPLNLSNNGDDNLQAQLVKQKDAIVALQDVCLDAPTDLPEEVTELASKLKGAAQTRLSEAQDAISATLKMNK